ncbi:OsmC family protein [Mesorhizobium australicum]|uniref:OsmC family protein n=1 Tax=Mesorhizobium australicum TaxID=536018 RepID=UPI00333A4554
MGYNHDWKACDKVLQRPAAWGQSGATQPEDLLLASVSACHMLWYLHLGSDAGIVVHSYTDEPVGHGESEPNGAGRFVGITLRPRIEVESGIDLHKAEAIHHRIHEVCYIARSVNFPILVEADYRKL